jgi:hypothetical protein
LELRFSYNPIDWIFLCSPRKLLEGVILEGWKNISTGKYYVFVFVRLDNNRCEIPWFYVARVTVWESIVELCSRASGYKNWQNTRWTR